MAVSTSVAIYFIIWWVVLFAVLPWGIRSQVESGEVVPGSDPGAPALPKLWSKVIWTTVVSAVIFAALIGAAHAQPTDTYPDHPIKVVVPAAAGGVPRSRDRASDENFPIHGILRSKCELPLHILRWTYHNRPESDGAKRPDEPARSRFPRTHAAAARPPGW